MPVVSMTPTVNHRGPVATSRGVVAASHGCGSCPPQYFGSWSVAVGKRKRQTTTTKQMRQKVESRSNKLEKDQDGTKPRRPTPYGHLFKEMDQANLEENACMNRERRNLE